MNEVIIYLNNLYSSIEGFLNEEVTNALSYACSYAPKGSEFSTKCREGYWDGTRKLFKRKNKLFLTGLLSVVIGVLNKYFIQYKIVDKRVEPQISDLFITTTPRDYQKDAVSVALERTRGVIKGGCGSGKTNIMEFIISKTNLPTLVVTHTTAVFNQTIERFRRNLRIDIGVIGNGSWEFGKKITVGLTASLTRVEKRKGLREFLSKIECLLIDEAHHIPAKSCLNISEACPNAYYRIGLSASPWREDLADLLIQAVTGKQLIDINASYLIQRGYLSKPTIKFIHFKHQKQSRGLKYKDFYTKTIVENEQRNKLITDIVLIHALQGESVLVSVSRIKHGEILETMIKDGFKDLHRSMIKFVNGEDHPEELAQTLVDLHERKLLVVIATSVYKEGINVPALNVLMNCKAEDSSVAAFQTIGRALRKTEDKNTVLIYDIYDEGCRWLGAHSQSREKIYSTEPEFVIQHHEAQNV